MKKRPPPEPAGDVPLWFMTYSDVITLMMTFFILLLTFATNEPESYEQMQASMFGGAGAMGIAGDILEENDAVLMRQRLRLGRATDRGSEMPPMESSPTAQALL